VKNQIFRQIFRPVAQKYKKELLLPHNIHFLSGITIKEKIGLLDFVNNLISEIQLLTKLNG